MLKRLTINQQGNGKKEGEPNGPPSILSSLPQIGKPVTPLEQPEPLQPTSFGSGFTHPSDSIQTTSNEQPLVPNLESPDNGFHSPVVYIGKKKIPLYTTRLGRGVLKVFGHARGLSTEVARVGRDKTLKRILDMDTDPEITVVSTAGLKVELVVPVVQISSTGGTLDRVRRATDGLVQTGKYQLPARIPSGNTVEKDDDKTVIIIPTPSYKKRLAPRHIGANNRTQYLEKAHKDWPLAMVRFSSTGAETGLDLLRKRGIQVSPADAAARQILPNLTLTIRLKYIDSETGHAKSVTLPLPMSESSLRFDQTGEIVKSMFVVNGKMYHPALVSLQDFAALVSHNLRTKTRGQATIDEDVLLKAFKLAPTADEDTKAIIAPYIERMEDIGNLNQILLRFPGVFSQALAKTVIFSDSDGNPSPQAVYIATEIIGSILGFVDAPFPADHPLSYVETVQLIAKILAQARYQGTVLQWAGNGNVVDQAIATAQHMPELYEMVKKMGVNNPEALAERRHVMSAGEFFTLALTPINLFANSMSLLLQEQAQGQLIRDQALREVARATTIIAVSKRGTELDVAKWDEALKNFNKLAPTIAEAKQQGGIIGEAVAKKLRDAISAAAGEAVIEAGVSTSPASSSTAPLRPASSLGRPAPKPMTQASFSSPQPKPTYHFNRPPPTP